MLIIMNLIIMNHDNHCDYEVFSEVILENDHDTQNDHNVLSL